MPRRRLPFIALILAFSLVPWLTPLLAAQISEQYAQAERLIRTGHFDEGIELLAAILSKNPKNPSAHNLMGIALTAKGKSQEADAEYSKALAIKPDYVPALKNLAINELTQHNTAAALRRFTTTEKLAPEDAVVQAYPASARFRVCAQHKSYGRIGSSRIHGSAKKRQWPMKNPRSLEVALT